ncbi:MAG: hypothetical protein KC635_15010, partial [Myxococcales bacterium]|nr:hypothetical protein [Myxococcales bacterium]
YAEQVQMLAPEESQAPADDVMFDPAQHMAAMGEEPAPKSTADPATLNAARVGVLRRDLEAEYAANAAAARELWPQVDDLEEKLKTAAPEDKQALEEKKKALEKQLADADKKTEQARKDLAVLDKGPDVTDAQLNDMLARREVTVPQAASADVAKKTEWDAKDGVKKTKTSTTNAMDADGASVTDKTTDETKVGLTGGSKTKSTEKTEIAGGTTKKTSSSTTKGVDLKDGSYTTSKTDETSTAGPDGKSGTKTTESTKVSAGGVTKSKSTTETKGDDKSTASSSTGVERGDGKLGVKKTKGTKVEKGDGSSTESSQSVSGGVIAGKDGVGVYGSQEQSASKKTKGGVTVSGKSSVGGRVLYNILPVEGSDPPKYQVQVSVKLDAALGAGASKEWGKDSKASVGASGSLSASITASFSDTLDEAQTEAWKAQLKSAEGGVGSGRQEFQIIAAGVSQGWGQARILYEQLRGNGVANDLKSGQSAALSAEVKGGAKGDASASGGGLSAGGGVGYEKGRKFEGKVSRDDDGTTTDVKVTDSSALSGDLKGGYGAASMSIGGKSTDSEGLGYSFRIPDDHPDAAALRAEAEKCTTKEAMAAFAKAHPDLVASKTTQKGHGEDVKTGVGLGPASIEMTSGGSTDTERKTTYDEAGNVTGTDAKYTGESHLGGSVGVGPVSFGDNSKEQVVANVKTEKGKDGKTKQTASADVSDTDTEKSIDVDATVKGLGEAVDKPLGLITGSTKIVKEKEKKAVGGFFMDDADFERVMALAKDPHAWNGAFSKVYNMDDWKQCRREVLAAGKDKEAVAAALAKFSGGGKSGRNVNLGDLIGVNSGGGGDRYEFPDGVGDQKSAYLSLVVNDPLAAVEKLAAEGKVAEAAKKAQDLATQCKGMLAKIRAKKGEFENANVYGEMVTRASKRALDLETKATELAAKAAGKTVDPEKLDGEKAQKEFDRLMGVCKDFKEQEVRLFGKIDENFGGLMGNHSTADNVDHVNELKANLALWKPQYQQMMELAELHGFKGGGASFKLWRPDEARLKMAMQGDVNPNSDEAMEAQDKADHEEAMRKESDEIAAHAMKSISSTAGMTHMGGGTYYREYTSEEKKQREAEEYEKMRPRVDDDFASRSGRVAGLRATAQQAMGKCNRLTSAGNWDKVSKAAMGPYNEGYRLYSQAEKQWNKAVAAQKTKSYQGLTGYFGPAQKATSAYKEAAAAFKKGDALQG